MPNARTTNTTPNIGLKGVLPNVRVSAFQTGRAGENKIIAAGTPIGLLLSLTYATDSAAFPYYSDFRPSVNIKSY